MKKIYFLLMLVLWAGSLSAQQSQNYVKTYTARVATQHPLNSSVNDNSTNTSQSTKFVDGLGRVKQEAVRWGSPTSKDVILPFVYDNHGRMVRRYLPYADQVNTANGQYRTGALTDQSTFFNGHFGGSAGGYAHSEQEFENSPLQRVLKSGAPGEAWKVGGIHSVITKHRPSTLTDEVRNFKLQPNDEYSTTISYLDGALWVSESWDENTGVNEGHSIQFTDQRGNVVLKKVKSGDGYLQTYYLYDELDRPLFILPPAGTAEIIEKNDWTLVNDGAFQQKWMFAYEYDHRGRMVSKRVPGSSWIYMVYDKRDRLVLTQDGNQRSKGPETIIGNQSRDAYEGVNYRISAGGKLRLTNGFRFRASAGNTFRASFGEPESAAEWIYTKYDAIDRPVLTGILKSTESRETLQQMADLATVYGESFTGSGPLEGYSNETFPKAVAAADILTAIFYDGYGFVDGELPTDYYPNVKGQVTGGRTRILGTGQMLETITYYDERYRPIMVVSDNHLSGKDTLQNTYQDLLYPLAIETRMVHTSNSSETPVHLEITESYGYDHLDRLTTVDYRLMKKDAETGMLNTIKDLRLTANEYNEIGELSSKTIGDGIQKVDFQYNIRGWLTRMNTNLHFDDANDKFAMVLQYENAGSLSQYNGNIARMHWRVIGGSGPEINNQGQNYTYTYDALSRLKSAVYASPQKDGDYDVSGITYDENGNIKSLDRKKKGTNLDLLKYQYNGNQLIGVEDTSGNEDGFKDGVTENIEYGYDANGNMVFDKNKEISNIVYNHLNLPTLITKGNGEQVSYSYDATGVKLTKESNVARIDYVAGKHYRNGELDFFQHAEGRVVKSENTYQFEYNLTDHLGNVRAVVDSIGNVVQRQGYYPFGGTFNNYNSTSPRNQYTFNGNEEQPELEDLMDFNARFYDKWTGRFGQVDPLADTDQESWNPYHFSYNNPILYSDPSGLMPNYQATTYQEGDTKNFVEVDDGVDRLVRLNYHDFQEAKFFANEINNGAGRTDSYLFDAYKDFYDDHVYHDGFWDWFMDSGPSKVKITGILELGMNPLLTDLLSGPGKNKAIKEIGEIVVKKGGKYVFQKHHIVPKAIWKKYKSILKPFLRDGPFNLKKLPVPFHGNHPQYNIYVGNELAKLIDASSGVLTEKALRNFQKTLRHQLRDAYNSGQKINDYFRQFN